MGISTAGHLPNVTSTSFPSLVHCLQSTHGAQRSGNWSVSIRMLRSQLSLSSKDASTLQQSKRDNRTMYVVQLSEFPDQTFVLIEDNSRPTRATLKGMMDEDAAKRALSGANQASGSVEADADGVKQAGSERNKSFPEAHDEGDQQMLGTEGAASQEQDQKSINQTNEGDKLTAFSKAEVTKQEDNADSTKVTEEGTPAANDENAAKDNDAGNLLSSVTTTQIPDVQKGNRVHGPTRQVLFSTSAQYMLLLARLNLPPPLGAPASGEGAILAGPGAWLPRGAPTVIQGYIYDLPSAHEPFAGKGSGMAGGEWRVRLGMLQSGGTRSAGAIVENEYVPLAHINDESFLLEHLQNLFPIFLTDPALANQSATATSTAPPAQGTVVNGPLPSQWAEVVPASHSHWMQSIKRAGKGTDQRDADAKDSRKPKRRRNGLAPNQAIFAPHAAPDLVGWHHKERGRRLAFMYVTLLRNQGIL